MLLHVQFEQERGHVPSAIEVLINQYGITEIEAKEKLQKHIVNAWKDLNQEFFRPTIMPGELLMRIFNLARVYYVIYTGQDHFTNSQTSLKNHVTSLRVNPLAI